jgi:CBS-domain-containing membrane protein
MTTTAHGRRTPHAALRPRRLRVADVMSRDVVTVSPTATVREIAGLMRRHAVSALPARRVYARRSRPIPESAGA